MLQTAEEMRKISADAIPPVRDDGIEEYEKFCAIVKNKLMVVGQKIKTAALKGERQKNLFLMFDKDEAMLDNIGRAIISDLAKLGYEVKDVTSCPGEVELEIKW